MFDDEGVLQVAMYYPHSKQKMDGSSNVDVTEPLHNNIRVAGLMHEPAGWFLDCNGGAHGYGQIVREHGCAGGA